MAAEQHLARMKIATKRLSAGDDFDELQVDWSACLRHFKLGWAAIAKFGKEASRASRASIYQAEHELKRDSILVYMLAARNAEEHEEEKDFVSTVNNSIGAMLIGRGALAVGAGTRVQIRDCLFDNQVVSGDFFHHEDGTIEATAFTPLSIDKERNSIVLNAVTNLQGTTVYPPDDNGSVLHPLTCANHAAIFLSCIIKEIEHKA